MHFFALRIVCPNCGAAFLVGGSSANDLARWRGVTVECRDCATRTSTANALPVDLNAPAPSIEPNASRVRRKAVELEVVGA